MTADIVPAISRFSIGLALGGGTSRGLAHIIAVETLDELGLRPAVVAGTSIGSIMGAACASGMPGSDMRQFIEELFGSRRELLRRLSQRGLSTIAEIWNPRTPALINLEGVLSALLPRDIPGTFEALKIPLAVVATDFYGQGETVMTDGPLIPALAASAAIPAVFKPVRYKGRVLIDGGFVNPVPFDLLRGRADIIVGVDVSGEVMLPDGAADTHMPSSLEASIGAFHITLRSIVREKLKREAPDILIRARVGSFAAFDFYRFKEILAASEPVKDELKRGLDRRLNEIAKA
ncbi:MAG: patatin-like phospholipase family protein [Hyphomicrobiaceae bacterium]|nr:MAG: patatin-like phospholipase family protein [Hyphomicrobiaceae bacterium]